MRRRTLFGGVLSLLVPALVFAGVNLPFTFSAGTPAKASEVNANFVALRDGLATSGTRLKIATVHSVDGLRSPLNQPYFYDSVLKTVCTPTATDTDVRCMPVVTAKFKSLYSDAECSHILYGAASTPVGFGSAAQMPIVKSLIFTTYYRTREYQGAVYTGTTGNCSAASSGSEPLYESTDLLTDADFALLTFTVE